ncbi:hypothetical protein [Streptomyces sp. NPDC085937]|uniref:hypothetical protein n=1 Tax=Streptomyces sp. NPDC085937 TaxID=3365742 RepID=UPI0037D197C8
MASPTRPADVVEEALARVWTEAHREFGPDEKQWTPGQVREYLLRLDAAELDPGSVAL